MQRVQFTAFQKNMEKAERIQGLAEKLQERGAQLVGVARKLLFFAAPFLILFVVFLMLDGAFR